MDTETRRNNIAKTIRNARAPISATVLAQKFNVSRQIIVGDIALLRAEGVEILATPKGYILESIGAQDHIYIGTIAVQHDTKGTRGEMYIIVDHGGTVMDVTVEHTLYGQLSGQLNISSRIEVDEFCEKIAQPDVKPLSDLTGGIHIHRIGCASRDIFEKISTALDQAGYLI